jgi:phosphohistidine phosphatase
MILYVARHAEALPLGGAVTRDADRILSPKGEEDAALMGRFLAGVEPGLTRIVTSPAVRAAATAAGIGKAFKSPLKIIGTESLAAGAIPGNMFREIIALANGGPILAVGHQPDLSDLISYLIVGEQGAGIAMVPGGLASLEVEGTRPQAALRWLVTPAIIRTQFT